MIVEILEEKRSLCVFEPLFGGFWATYAAHLRLIESSYSVNWTFLASCYGWGATSEYRLEIGVFKEMGQFRPKFDVGTSTTNRFSRLGRPVHAVQLCRLQYSHKETL